MKVVPLYEGKMFYGAKSILGYLGLDYDTYHNYFNVRLNRRSAVIKGIEIEYISIPYDIYELLKVHKILVRKDFVRLLTAEDIEELKADE